MANAAEGAVALFALNAVEGAVALFDRHRTVAHGAKRSREGWSSQLFTPKDTAQSTRVLPLVGVEFNSIRRV